MRHELDPHEPGQLVMLRRKPVAEPHDASVDFGAFLVEQPSITVPYSISAAHLMAEEGDVTLVDSLLTQAQRFDGLVKLAVTPEMPITVCLMTVRSRPPSRLAARLVEIVTGQ